MQTDTLLVLVISETLPREGADRESCGVLGLRGSKPNVHYILMNIFLCNMLLCTMNFCKEKLKSYHLAHVLVFHYLFKRKSLYPFHGVYIEDINCVFTINGEIWCIVTWGEGKKEGRKAQTADYCELVNPKHFERSILSNCRVDFFKTP